MVGMDKIFSSGNWSIQSLAKRYWTTFGINFLGHYNHKYLGFCLMGENPLRCTTQDKKGLVLIKKKITLYFNPHKK
jgi:hypothetical protein